MTDESADCDDTNSRAPLRGLRVLDLTRVLAGPFCTMLLADLGAEVVKIERPEVGDDARHFGPFLPSGLSAYFASLNRGKKSVVLDLKSEQGRQSLLKLAEQADVLVENFTPGTLETLGLSPTRLRELNPRLIIASASGFGQTGARSGRPAYDIIVQAMSGLMSITGSESGESVRVGTSIADILTGMFTAIGVLASLAGRERTGVGVHLDLAMLDCTVAALENAISRYVVTGQTPGPLGSRHPSIAPFQAFQAADGPLVVAAGNDALWKKLCVVLDSPELIDDPKLLSNHTRSSHLEYLDLELTRRFQQRSVAEWLVVLEAAGVPAAPIRNIAEVVSDEHLAERGMMHAMRDGGKDFLTAGSPLRMDGAGLNLSPHAPTLGEHTETVMQEWLAN